MMMGVRWNSPNSGMTVEGQTFSQFCVLMVLKEEQLFRRSYVSDFLICVHYTGLANDSASTLTTTSIPLADHL